MVNGSLSLRLHPDALSLTVVHRPLHIVPARLVCQQHAYKAFPILFSIHSKSKLS
jgi:hypothetical protein